MMKEILTFLLIVLLPSLLVSQVNQTVQNRSVVFNQVTVIDVTGAPSKSGMTVIITGNRIAAVSKSGKVKIPKDAQIIDASGKFMIPGLWDMHVHSLFEGRTEIFFPDVHCQRRNRRARYGQSAAARTNKPASA